MMRVMRVTRVIIRVTRRPLYFCRNCSNSSKGRGEAQQMTDPRNRNEAPGRERVLVGGRAVLVGKRELRRPPRIGRAVGLASREKKSKKTHGRFWVSHQKRTILLCVRCVVHSKTPTTPPPPPPPPPHHPPPPHLPPPPPRP